MIVRRIDDLGRIVIPKEIRKDFDIHEGNALEIFIEPSKKVICLQKYQPIVDPIDNLKSAADTFGELGMLEEEKQVRELIYKLEHEE